MHDPLHDKNENFLIDQQLCSKVVLYYSKKSLLIMELALDFTDSTRNYAFISCRRSS